MNSSDRSFDIIMYTDGASRGNPGPGGYGTILHHVPTGKRKELSRGFKKTTNNRMELLAVIDGLRALKKPGLKVRVYSDSSYVVNAISKKWLQGWVKKGFKDKKNPDLWQLYLQVAKGFTVDMQWVRGHNGHPENERCDELAVQAALSGKLEPDIGFERLN
jgi:ribonuclease HI